MPLFDVHFGPRFDVNILCQHLTTRCGPTMGQAGSSSQTDFSSQSWPALSVASILVNAVRLTLLRSNHPGTLAFVRLSMWYVSISFTDVHELNVFFMPFVQNCQQTFKMPETLVKVRF